MSIAIVLTARDRGEDSNLIGTANEVGAAGRLAVDPHFAGRQDHGELLPIALARSVEQLRNRLTGQVILTGAGCLASLSEQS